MSKTLLTAEDVPAYIREIARNLRLTTDYQEQDLPGYTFKLYGRHKVGYESQIARDCEKLLAWCQRHYAEARIVSEHFWWTDVAVPVGSDRGDKWHKRKAFRDGFRNYIKVVITDPVAHRFEEDNFYKEYGYERYI